MNERNNMLSWAAANKCTSDRCAYEPHLCAAVSVVVGVKAQDNAIRVAGMSILSARCNPRRVFVFDEVRLGSFVRVFVLIPCSAPEPHKPCWFRWLQVVFLVAWNVSPAVPPAADDPAVEATT